MLEKLWFLYSRILLVYPLIALAALISAIFGLMASGADLVFLAITAAMPC